jgi:integrase
MARPKGLGIARGFDKSREHGWYVSVNRVKQYFSSEKERNKAYADKLASLHTGGLTAVAEAPTYTERQWLAEMRRLARPTGQTILEIFQRGLAQIGIVTDADRTLRGARNLFIEEQELRLKDGHITRSRFKEVKGATAHLDKQCGTLPIQAISRQHIKDHLLGLGVGPQTRLNRARTLSFFFRWAIDEGMLLKNPVPRQEGVDRIPAVFSNEQVAELFEVARDQFIEIYPMLLIQWYAAIRPGATHHLHWEHIDFANRRILIHPHANKMKQPDIVHDLPPTVFAALLPFAGTGRIAHSNHAKIMKAFHKHLGYHRGEGGKRWSEDVARHTCLSNLTALYDRDIKRVSDVALHTTSRTLLKHYLLKNLPKESAESYFSAHLPRC